MILDFGKEVSAIIDALGLDPASVDMDRGMKVAMVLVTVLDKGMSAERERIIRIVQQHAMNPMPLVERIRRPLR
jgi:hypothetical protein